MVSDDGNYPEGMASENTIVTYEDPRSAAASIRDLLGDEARLREIANAGNEMVRSRYSKQAQWQRFTQLAGA